MKEEHAYIYGLLLADGNLYLNTRNRGRITLEISERDKDILYVIQDIAEGQIHSRKRSTNFTNGEVKEFYNWANTKIEFRHELMEYGFPIEDKCLECDVPNILYNEIGFWRGYIDGNGSIGISAEGKGFVSVTIKSEKLKDAYVKFLLNKFGIDKNIHRNKRDDIYNIMVIKDHMQVLNYLYKDATIYINRKYNNYIMLRG